MCKLKISKNHFLKSSKEGEIIKKYISQYYMDVSCTVFIGEFREISTKT